MRYVSRLPGLLRGILFTIVLGWSQPGMAAAYYNLGAFWKQPPSTGCAPLATRVQNQSNFQFTVTSVSTPAFTETAGNLLVAAVYVEGTPQTITISDTTGGANTWHPLTMYSNTNQIDDNVRLFYATGIVGGANTVKATVGSADDMWISVTEYSGITGGTLDANTGFSASASTTSLQAGTLTIPGTSPGDLIVAIFSDANIQPSATAGSGFVRVAFDLDNYGYAMYEDNLSFSGTSAQATATSPQASSAWSAASAAFRVSCVPYSSFTPSSLAFDPSSPVGGPFAGGTSITITGQGFDPGATVSIGGSSCAVTSRLGTTSITCTTGAASMAGLQPIVVTDTNGRQATLTQGFLYGVAGSESWLGGIASGYSWNTYSANAPANFQNYFGSLDDQFVNPTKVVYGVTGTTGSIYVADYWGNMSVGRITRFDATSGAEIGWIGAIEQTPTGDPLSLGCTSALPGNATPGFCLGGNSAGEDAYNSVANGSLMYPTGMALDPSGSTLYVADWAWQTSRVSKFNAITGQFLGWIGYGVTSGGSSGCPANGVSTGWCSGATVSNIYNNSAEGAFADPSDVAVDPSNTYLYVYDWGNSRVQQFNVATGAYIGWLGAVTGPTGPSCATTNPHCTPGTSGQFSGGFVTGGASNSSSVSGGINGNTNNAYQAYLYVDANYLYLTDPGDYRVERYNLPSGTFAGWLGWVGTSNGSNCTTTNAYSGTWCNAGGAAAQISSNAGNWAGGFNTPQGITSDGTYLYVTEQDLANVTRIKLDGSSPAWIGEDYTTSAFNGGWSSANVSVNWDSDLAGGMSGTTGVAVDAADGWLFVTDSGNHRVNRYTLSTGAFNKYLFNQPTSPTGWTTSGQPQLGNADGMISNTYTPYGAAGVALDPVNGMIYVSDTGSSRIDKFNLSTGAFQGWVSAVSLSPTGGAAGCTGLSFGAVTPGWCTGGQAAGNPGYASGDGYYSFPLGLAVDPSGTYLYVAENFGQRISRIKTSDGTPQGFIGYIDQTGTGCGASVGSTSGWCAGSGAHSDSVTSGNIPDTEFNGPVGLAIDTAGSYLYVGNNLEHRVLKIAASTGIVQGWIGWGTNTGGSAGCPPSGGGVTTGWCSGGNTTLGSTALAGGFNNPGWVAVDSSGNLWVSDYGNNRIEEFNASSGAYIGSFATISTQAALSFGLDGNGRTLITYERYNGPKSFLRYSTATYALLGEMGYLGTGSLVGGQQGCTSVSPGSFSSLWCLPSDIGQQSSSVWGDNTTWSGSPMSQIAVDSSNHYMYFEDYLTGRLVRMPINQ